MFVALTLVGTPRSIVAREFPETATAGLEVEVYVGLKAKDGGPLSASLIHWVRLMLAPILIWCEPIVLTTVPDVPSMFCIQYNCDPTPLVPERAVAPVPTNARLGNEPAPVTGEPVSCD